MAFINENLTPETKAYLASKIVNEPFRGGERRFWLPTRWTIDKERNIFLAWASGNMYDSPGEVYFVFYYINDVVEVHVHEELKNNVQTWDLLNIRIPSNLITQKNEIITTLKEALTVYAFDGRPDNPKNLEVTVAFKF